MMNFRDILDIINTESDGRKVELHPVYDSRASFYKKAMLVYHENIIMLYSYSTPVLALVNDEKNRYYVVNDSIDSNLLYSNTTLRHMKEVLKQCYMIDYTKKEIIANNQKEL